MGNKIKGDPERIRKQAEKFEAAVKALMETHNQKQNELEVGSEVMKKQSLTLKEKEEQRSKAQLRLQMITESAKITDISCEDVKKQVLWEEEQYNELTLK